MATGLGKTVLFANLKNYTGWQGKVLVLVHREELATQAQEKIHHWNPGAMCMIEMGDNKSLPDMCDFIVAGVQSLKSDKRLAKFNPKEFCAVVVDEAHHATANSYRKVIDYFTNGNLSTLLLGVTATPNRADGEGLGSVFSEIVDDYGIFDGIEDGWLAPLLCEQIKTTTNLSGVKTKFGDFNATDLDKVVDTPTRNLEIVNGWKQYAPGRKTAAYCVSVEHAMKLAHAFQQQGVKADFVVGGDPKRQEKLEKISNGELSVITNCEVLTEGWDLWDISCVLLARPTQSESLYTQMVGRGTRIDPLVYNMKQPRAEPRKKDCLVLDCTDISSKHSLVSLSTLFGVPKKLKASNKPIHEIAKKYNKAKTTYPEIDFSEAEDVDALDVYAKKVNLFEVKWSPEVVQHSKYKWYKVDNNYTLVTRGKEGLTIKHDQVLGKFRLSGTISQKPIYEVLDDFKSAINLGDQYVNEYGDWQDKNFVQRKTKWMNDTPTTKQLRACKWLGIPVPPGATKGEVHSAISAAMAKKNATN